MKIEFKFTCKMCCVKSIRIRSYSGQQFPAFRLNMERYSISLRIQSECGKMRIRITPNTDTFYAVLFHDFHMNRNKLKLICWFIQIF